MVIFKPDDISQIVTLDSVQPNLHDAPLQNFSDNTAHTLDEFQPAPITSIIREIPLQNDDSASWNLAAPARLGNESTSAAQFEPGIQTARGEGDMGFNASTGETAHTTGSNNYTESQESETTEMKAAS